MGVLSIIWNIIVGPLLIVGLIFAHTFGNMFLATPGPIQVQDFPMGTTQEQKDARIGSRQSLVKASIEFMKGSYKGDFVKDFCTSDIEFEDAFQLLQGEEEFRLLDRWIKTYELDNIVTVYSEHHGAHEIIIDLTQNITLTFLPSYPLPIRMRSHFLLASPDKTGKERLLRLYEDWMGNDLLTEKTTIPFIGRFHQKWRKFVGFLLMKAMRNGYI